MGGGYQGFCLKGEEYAAGRLAAEGEGDGDYSGGGGGLQGWGDWGGGGEMNNQDVFIEILMENWRHLRHQETVRMWIGNVFIAIVVAMSAYLGKTLLDITQVPIFVPIVILVVSILCLLVTLKTNKVFKETQNSIINIFEDKRITFENQEDWRKYVGMLQSTNVVWDKILRVRCLYVALYVIAIIASLIWFVFLLIE